MTKADQAVETAADKVASFVLERPKARKQKRRRGPSPWLVVGAAFAAGYVLAKTIDWRGHAHPRL